MQKKTRRWPLQAKILYKLLKNSPNSLYSPSSHSLNIIIMNLVNDPRNTFTEVVKTAETYQVIDAHGPKLIMEHTESKDQRTMDKDSHEAKNNPLLGEVDLYDLVTIEERIHAQIGGVRESLRSATSGVTLPLIVKIDKTSREAISLQRPSVITVGTGLAKIITLDHFLEEENYLPPVFHPIPNRFQTIPPQDQEE